MTGIFVLAALTRLLYLLVMRPTFESFHWDIADGLLRSSVLGESGVSSTFNEPGYPVFLSLLRVISGDTILIIQALQALVDSVGAVLLYRLIAGVTGRPRAALLGGVLYACYPLLVRHSVQIGEASLLSVLLLAFACTAMTATTPVRVGVAGVWLGLAILTRAMVAPVAVLAVGVFLIEGRRRAAIVLAVTVITVASPMALRNYVFNGSLLSTRSGAALLIAHSPYTPALLPEYNHDLLENYIDDVAAREDPALLAPAAERELDRFYTDRALAEMRARPLQTLQLTLRKAAYFFWPRLVPARVKQADTRVFLGPNGQLRVENSPPRPLRDDLAYTLSFCPIALAALAGMWRRRFELTRDAILWCIALTFVAVYAVFVPDTHYRAPMEFVLLFYAAVALDSWSRGWRRPGRAAN